MHAHPTNVLAKGWCAATVSKAAELQLAVLDQFKSDAPDQLPVGLDQGLRLSAATALIGTRLVLAMPSILQAAPPVLG
jgi:hypothetical protein